MFLSNPRKFFLIAGFLALILQACGSSAGNENKPVFLTVEKKSEFPFSTKEPEVYQGDFVVGNGNWEEKWFIARKGEKFRIDFRLGTDSMWTEIKSDKIYSVSQTRRIYAEVSGGEFPQNDSTALNFLKDTFFTGLEYRDFDDLGRDGFLKKYNLYFR